MKISIATAARFLAALCMALAPAFASAQAFPAKPVRIVVPFPAGGLTDVVARALGQDLTKAWAQPVLVENRPGANQQIAAEFVSKQAGDGYTIIFTDKTPFAIMPALYSKLPYDPVKDFIPVTGIMQTSTVLVVPAALGVNTWQEFVALARTKPGELNYGTFGPGSVTHLDTETLSGMVGIKLNHIPYKGIAEVLPAVAAGQIQTALSGISPVMPFVKQGRLKAIALAANQRSPVLPDVPTFTEMGVPLVSISWFGLLVPGGTPRPIVDKIATDVRRTINMPEFRDKYITSVGLELFNQGPDELAATLNSDRARYATSVKNANIKLD
ncbi:MAG: tripartite tricarboxylate transporter substrate binding protein [Betaproteobacteria bacterium]|nr:tripartite tricarboxylate transporter substrate binding protein [Betaproteobacteria bacterium]